MSNILKVEFSKTFLTKENIKYLLNNYEVELKTNNFKSILEKELDIKSLENPYLLATIEYMSQDNQPWPYDKVPQRIFYKCINLTNIEIPSSVTSIEKYAFEECSNLNTVIFTGESKLTSIGSYAFQNCSSLTSITIPSSVTSIGEEAFWGCSSLTSITIPNSVTSIGSYAFRGCSSLTSVTFVEGSQITSIGWGAFGYCDNLSTVTFEEGSKLKIIEKSAFEYCFKLTSITIPNSVKRIGYKAFDACYRLVISTKNPYVIDYCEKNKIKYKQI